jgi:transcriptional regulator with XRE-family HTH domain
MRGQWMEGLNRLYEIRCNLRLSLRDLSSLTGISYVTLDRIENGFSIPNQLKMLRIARGLKMEVDEIFNLEWRDLNF